jgi:hypothetical protein
MVVLALTSLAALLAWRNLWVNELGLNAEADQLRTQHKAEAMMAIARLDILGISVFNNKEDARQLRHAPGLPTQTHAFFPNSSDEYDVLRQRLRNNDCSAGICARDTLDAKTSQAHYWQAQTETAMAVGAPDAPYSDNSAWYWVEVFPPSDASKRVYRITALAQGMMAGSTTVLQGIWVRDTISSTTGQWCSWHLLHD